MSKRTQEKTGEERLMGKSRPTLHLVSKTVASSSTAQSSSASNYPAILRAPCQSLRLTACVEKPAAKGSDIVDVDSKEPKNFQSSVAYVPHLEKVQSKLRQKIGRKSGDDTNNLDTNSLIWGMFMSATLDAGAHLGRDYLENLHSIKKKKKKGTKIRNEKAIVRYSRCGQQDGGPQGMLLTGGGGTHEGPEPACVQTPMDLAWHTRGGEGRIKVLP